MKCELNIYDNKKTDTSKQPLFFGCSRNTQRFDKVRYNFLDKLNVRMQSFFWRPDEISMKKDNLDFNENCTEAEKFIFTTQLQKLVMLDSIQGRGPILTFSQLTTNPEFENCILTWEFFEGAIHSRSYSYNIEQVYADPNKVFDDSWNNKLLLKHANTISKYYNDLYHMVLEYQNYQQANKIDKEFLYKLKKQLLLAIVDVNILEGIRFYPGFAAVWGIAEFSNKLPGSSLILQLIARDENQHMALTQWLLNKLRKDDEEGFTVIWEELESTIYDMYWTASEEEFKWTELLYSKGSPLGINAEIGKQYIKYLINIRLKAIGLRPLYPEINRNPIPWVEKWLQFSKIEGALQEEEAIDYKMGAINKDINKQKAQKIISKYWQL